MGQSNATSSQREEEPAGQVELQSGRSEPQLDGPAVYERDERFRQVVETIHEVFWMTDPAKNEMLYVSPAYETIWGRSCDDLYASPHSWLEAIHPEDRERVLR